jgi:rare lipoprotein A
MDRVHKAHLDVTRAGRLALVLMASASLAACASLTTPTYSISQGGQGGAASGADGGAHGSATRPQADPGAHGTNAPYQVGGIWYVPHEQPRYDETGIASWYGDAFNMKATANGETFDMSQISAAHTTLPLPSMVEVTNLDNGRKLTVRVNDRGPFVGGRLIDLSHAAAAELGYERAGVAHVRVKYLGPAPLAGPEAGVRYAKVSPPSYGRQSYASQSYAAQSYAAQSYVQPLRSASNTSGGLSIARPADEEIFGEAATPTVAVAPLVPKPAPVAVASLTPLPAATRSSRDPYARDPYISDVIAHRTAPAAASAVAATSAPAQIYRIQAGAFSDELNAKRAAAQLAAAGTATVEPFERSGVTFYRVYVPGPADETQAYAVRDKVAAIGFADARVVKP